MIKKEFYTVRIEVLTGLHIGVGTDQPEIGGIDNVFIKDPITKLPYIPGSSLKGKLRSLLEIESDINHEEIKLAFEGDENSPTRLIFRDLRLESDWAEKFNSGIVHTEVKTEIKISRETGKTVNGTLRTTERVPPQTVFEGEIVLRYKDDDKDNIEEVLNSGIELLNNDYLGGSGSRGYGAVNVTLTKKS